jgi:FAD synthase
VKDRQYNAGLGNRLCVCICLFSWAQLVADPSDGFSEADLGVHKMVMNVGRRPTVNTGQEDPTVEVHVMHTFSGDFYGKVCDWQHACYA